MSQCGGALELLGMLVLVGAWLSALAATIMPRWLTMSTSLLPVESYELGLWGSCVVQGVGGGMECRAYDSLLGLATDLQLARVLMCSALAVGMLGILVAVPGLQMIDSCRRGVKRSLLGAAGVLAVVAGVLCLVPVSYMAHSAVVRFFDDKVPDVVPRWEFGDALFCGWAAGFLLVGAGLLMGASSSCPPQGDPPRRAHGVASNVTANKRTEYV